MKIANIYDAVSGLDEKYVLDAENSEAVRLSFRKNRARKIKMIRTVSACAAVVIATGLIASQGWLGKKLPVRSDGFVTWESTSGSDDSITEQTQIRQTTDAEQSTTAPSKEMESQISKTENHTQTSTTVNQNLKETRSKALQPRRPVTTKTVERPTASSKETRSGVPLTSRPFSKTIVEKQTDYSVVSTSVEATSVLNPKKQEYKDFVVDYETAKKSFMHPLIPCRRNDFTGYNVLLYNSNGDFNEQGTKCLSVTYLFTNGSVSLYDQSKTGKITPAGNREVYRGKAFYVKTPEFNGDQIRVGYFPTGESGIAYQANFNSRTNVNEIMDLMLSLEK